MKNHTTRLVILVLFATTIFLFNCDGDNPLNSRYDVHNTNYIAVEEFLFEVDVANQSLFRLTAVNGSISITGESNSDSIIITGERRVGSESTEDAEEHLELLEVRVQELTDEIYIRTIQPNETYGRNYEVDYEITLPDGFMIIASHVNGSVTVGSINNTVTVSNVNGQIDLNDISGSAIASLVNGQIEGDVVLPSNGLIAMSTVNGNVVLNIPVNTSAEFEASRVNGSINIRYLDLQNEVITSTSRRGILGNGDGEISLSTVNGNIWAIGF
ncbi:MAG: DUF4097 domain-containing protein [candidate division Zixibacteria bacterium]|nr:DUF4097 domain-containing protein [candidate division Zixibacteria bacterium]